MEKKFNQLEYQNQFNKKNYDRIEIVVPKGDKAMLKQKADAEGKSLNQFLKDLIYQNM